MSIYECHGHIALGEGTIEEKFKALADCGVSYFRDAGANIALYRKLELCDSSAPIADTALKIRCVAESEGIEYKTPVFAFYKEGLYGKFLGESFSDTKDFYEKVLDVKKQGADFIKVMFSGIASFKHPGKLSCEPLSPCEIKEIVNIVHGEGFKLMAHCNGADTIKYAIEYGADSVEHGIFIDDEGIGMLREASDAKNPCIWVPTITAIANEKLRRDHIESVAKAAKAGALIASGSDFGAGSTLDIDGKDLCPAISELDYLKKAGLSEDLLKSTCERIKNGFAL